MNKLILTSMRRSAGKTSMAVGIGLNSGLGIRDSEFGIQKPKLGYIKPFGDRLLYREKHLWDYDAALMRDVFGLESNPEEMSIGFQHSKLRYMYGEDATKKKILEMVERAGKNKDLLIIEGGMYLSYGASVRLDAISIAKCFDDEKLVIVVGGNEDAIMDDIAFIKKYVDLKNVNFSGIIINKVRDVGDFTDTHLGSIKEMGVEVLGVVPYKPELTYMPVRYVADNLDAKVIAGEGGLDKVVKCMTVGAMSVTAAMQNPIFKKEGKLLITAGDRSDMILAAIESNTSCIVLTNDIIPPSNIISKAADANVPLLLVPWDTYQTTMRVEHIEPLLTKGDAEKIEILKEIVKKNVNLKEILG